jgi:hypothetical protein
MNEKTHKFVLAQFISIICNIIATVTVIGIFINNYAYESFLLNVIASIFLGFIVSNIFNLTGLFIINKFLYKGDVEEMVDDIRNIQEGKQTEQIISVEITIVERSPYPIARYMDADIYEWIIVRAADGTLLKYNFDGTMNTAEAVTIESDCFIIEPGIVYRKAG